MDNLTESLAERIFASLIERALGTNVNLIYTLGGIFSAVTVLLMSFTALVEIGYWPVDMISDDSAVFWKASEVIISRR